MMVMEQKVPWVPHVRHKTCKRSGFTSQMEIEQVSSGLTSRMEKGPPAQVTRKLLVPIGRIGMEKGPIGT